jgi:protein phosphatase
MVTVELHAASHVGRVRRGNEDNYLLLDLGTCASTSHRDGGHGAVEVVSRKVELERNGLVLAVSDGMGGALAGEVASQMAVEVIGDALVEAKESSGNPDHLISKLYEAVLSANTLIHQRGREPEFQGMGATFTGVSIHTGTSDFIQIGDSRAYLIRDTKIYQITKDQSLVQQLIDTKQLSEADAESHTLRNVILQALGAQVEVFPVTSRLVTNDNDVLLLCSDGLSNKLSKQEMQEIVETNSENLAEGCRELIGRANENGGEDNITVIVARITGDTLPLPSDTKVRVESLDLGNVHDTEE